MERLFFHEFGTEVTHNWLEVNSGVSVIESDLFGPSKVVDLPEKEVSCLKKCFLKYTLHGRSK